MEIKVSREHIFSLFILFCSQVSQYILPVHLVCYTVYLQVVVLLISVCVVMNMHCFPQLCHICYGIRRGGFRGLLPLFSSTLKCLSIETQVRVAPVRSSVYVGVRAASLSALTQRSESSDMKPAKIITILSAPLNAEKTFMAFLLK